MATGLYFSVLIPHVVLAALVVPLALTTIHHGLTSRFDKHVRIARWTLPIWLYVSISGVLVYRMLYWLDDPAPTANGSMLHGH